MLLVVSSALAPTQAVNAGLERTLVDDAVDAVGERAEAPVEILLAGLHVTAKEARGLVVALAGGDQRFCGGLVARVIELPVDPEGIGEIEVPDPPDVDSGRRHDGLDVLQPRRGLDQRDDKRALVRKVVTLAHPSCDSGPDPTKISLRRR